MNKTLTVFTPTYNRAYSLPALFQSLLDQTDKHFDWFVIDDGSKDSTSDYLFELSHLELPFSFRYLVIENGGKQRAINYALSKINTDYILILDSDDYLTTDAIEKVNLWINDTELDESYAGVSGVKGDPDGKPLAGEPSFLGEFVDATNLERNQYNLAADMAEVYRTDLLRQYPFVVWPGETFVPESVVWDRIALDGYKIRWHKDVIYCCEYRDDGLTNNFWKLLKLNPMGYAMMYDLKQKVEKKKGNKWRYALQMASCLMLAKEPGYVFKSTSPIRSILSLPAGFLLSIRRRKQIKTLTREIGTP